MKKDAFYFPHYSNARNDRKLKRVIKDLGIEGYAIYFMVLEVLRDQPKFKYPIKDIDLLADEFGTTDAKLRVVINNYDLFTIDSNNDFFSIKQIQYLQPYIEKSKRATDAANKRWNNANAYANALQMECHSNANKVKESKVNETKEEEIKKPKFNFKKSLLDLGVDEIVVDTFLEVRKKKKAVNSELAFTKISNEIIKSGLTPNEAITIAAEKSWSGFEADWVKEKNFAQKKEKPTMRSTNEAFDEAKQFILNGGVINP